MFWLVTLVNHRGNFMKIYCRKRNIIQVLFMLSTDIDSNQPVVVVNQREFANHPPFGLVSCVQVTIYALQDVSK